MSSRNYKSDKTSGALGYFSRAFYFEIMKKQIQLSDHFTFNKLLRFTLPSIVMMVFTSIYGVVDGFFVSNFVGKTPFAAINLIYPFLMILGAVGFMLGSGGSALISKTLGEGNEKKANEQFSLIVYVSIALGVILSVVGIIFLPHIARLLKAEGQMLSDCVTYGTIILIALPAFLIQFEFQTFFVTAEKPQLGLVSTVVAGLTNMIFDALFMAVFNLGIEGAALATALSQLVGGIIPLVYFSRKNSSLLRLTKTKFNIKVLAKSCANGASEFMSNISMSIVSMLYNSRLFAIAGENGIAAYGVLMYINFVFLAIFIGYSVGVAPVIGYNLGAQNRKELKNLLKKSTIIISATAIFMLALAIGFASPLSKIFVGYDEELYQMTLRGFYLFSPSFLFAGIAIFSSALFTALNNGLLSAVISFLRTLLFQIASVLILSYLLKLDGIWISTVVAELLASILAIIFIISNKKKYGYL